MDKELKEQIYTLIMETLEDLEEPLMYDQEENILKINRAKEKLNQLKTKLEWM
jgi:hypothetical protein|tara:strand:+ start:494 stop:652 length:159 start_codon:yes stop_codon:yes gene_type:complete